MNNILSNYGLVYGRISTSEKDLPVLLISFSLKSWIVFERGPLSFLKSIAGCIIRKRWCKIEPRLGNLNPPCFYVHSSTMIKCTEFEFVKEWVSKSPQTIYIQGSPTYTKITNTVSTNTFFGLCACKWGN